MGGKYGEYSNNRRTSDKEYQRIHPVWRGVGCVMAIIIPIISWAAADVIITRKLIQLPMDLLAGPGHFLYNLSNDPYIHIRLLIFTACLLALFALITFISFIANSLFGVSRRNDPFYVPPQQGRPRRRN